MASDSIDSDTAAGLSGSGEKSRNRGRSGGSEGRQTTESALFSPPAWSREEELMRVQLLEGSKHRKKIGIREAAMAFRDSATVDSTVTSSDARGSHGSSTPAADGSSLTNDLLQLLLSEIARVRCSLEGLAQDRALLGEVQRSNKLLAFLLTSKQGLEFFDDVHHSYNDYIPPGQSGLLKRIEQTAKTADFILKTV